MTIYGFQTAAGGFYTFDMYRRTNRLETSPANKDYGKWQPLCHCVFVTSDSDVPAAETRTTSITLCIDHGYRCTDPDFVMHSLNFIMPSREPLEYTPASNNRLIAVETRKGKNLLRAYRATAIPAIGLRPIEKGYHRCGKKILHIGDPIIVIFTTPHELAMAAMNAKQSLPHTRSM